MLDADQWSQLLASFVEEARDLARQAEEYLLLLEAQPTNEDAINGLFRAMHTVKGSAGLFSLTPLVDFTHRLENLLMAVRDGQRQLDPALVSIMLRCVDEVGSMVELIDPANGQLEVDPTHQQQLLQALAEHCGEPPPALLIPLAQAESAEACRSRGQLERCASCDADGAWHISVRFHPDLLRNGFDPAAFLRYLQRLGDILDLQLVDESLPALTELDPESCYLGLEIGLCSAASKAEIEEVFEFIRDFCTLRILPPNSALTDYIALIQTLPETDERIGEILVKAGLLTATELAEGLVLQGAQPELPQPLGSLLVEQGMVAAQAVDAALNKQQTVREKRLQESAQIRVAAHKLDELINLVGELVISAAGAHLRARANGDGGCMETTGLVNQHVEQIREAALKLRMIEIGDTFNRFHRVVRDVSQQLGKDIRLEIRGADTELDKAVIDKLADPLTHLVRNAMDHGIESADERLAAGKPAEGRLILDAFHESGMVVIEIRDDGRGLNSARIREKAVERGLIDPTANLSEAEIHRLIFAAGFSTADAVSDLSGRGVGMDVVRSAIDALRGTVEIESRPGLGSTFRIRLPLTLAIIDGFLISLGEDHFVIPLDMVTECLEVDDHQLTGGSYGYISLRGRPLPCLSLASHFGLPESSGGRRNIVVVSQGRQQAGLIVDHLHGELQTVIKPLGRLFQHLQGIGGSTILGTGQVALILDVPSLFRHLQQTVDAHPADPTQNLQHTDANAR